MLGRHQLTIVETQKEKLPDLLPGVFALCRCNVYLCAVIRSKMNPPRPPEIAPIAAPLPPPANAPIAAPAPAEPATIATDFSVERV